MASKSEPQNKQGSGIRVAVFDFDGTLSTFRSGWEQVMRSMMLEFLNSVGAVGERVGDEVDAYIAQSTGHQTIYQMQWLVETIQRYQKPTDCTDAWWYKHEYTKRLKSFIQDRIVQVEEGETGAERYLIGGAMPFLQQLSERGIQLFLASGTDHLDVVHEATVLGLKGMFTEIRGAPVDEVGCSKESVIRMLIDDYGMTGKDLLIVGDGPVEIKLGCSVGALTIGVASDEVTGRGIDVVKKKRLLSAGAQVIIGDYEQPRLIFERLESCNVSAM